MRLSVNSASKVGEEAPRASASFPQRKIKNSPRRLLCRKQSRRSGERSGTWRASSAVKEAELPLTQHARRTQVVAMLVKRAHLSGRTRRGRTGRCHKHRRMASCITLMRGVDELSASPYSAVILSRVFPDVGREMGLSALLRNI